MFDTLIVRLLMLHVRFLMSSNVSDFILDINECVSNPCQNGGTCTDQVNQYACTCVPGYEGTNCQTGSNRCLSEIQMIKDL